MTRPWFSVSGTLGLTTPSTPPPPSHFRKQTFAWGEPWQLFALFSPLSFPRHPPTPPSLLLSPCKTLPLSLLRSLLSLPLFLVAVHSRRAHSQPQLVRGSRTDHISTGLWESHASDWITEDQSGRDCPSPPGLRGWASLYSACFLLHFSFLPYLPSFLFELPFFFSLTPQVRASTWMNCSGSFVPSLYSKHPQAAECGWK